MQANHSCSKVCPTKRRIIGLKCNNNWSSNLICIMNRILGLLLCFCLLNACTKPEQPTFQKLENIKFNSLSIRKPYTVKLDANARFHNPNKLGAQIKSTDFDLFINGIKTTHINQDVSVKMPAQSDFSLPISGTIPLQDVFKDLKLKDILKSMKIEYQIVGYLTIDLAGVAIKVPFDYEGEESLGL